MNYRITEGNEDNKERERRMAIVPASLASFPSVKNSLRKKFLKDSPKPQRLYLKTQFISAKL
jgi:hypothetical protein